MIDRVVLAVIAGLSEHSGVNLAAETVVSYVVSVGLYVATVMDLDAPVENDETEYFREAFIGALGGLVANHGTKWGPEQVFQGASTMAALAVASRDATYETMARHREEEAKKKAQAAVQERVKGMAGLRGGKALPAPAPGRPAPKKGK